MKSLFVLAFLTSAGVAASPETGTVVGVSDGDTVTILTASKERVKVRLAEIDAPGRVRIFV